jgi:putative addiction module killer protein
MIEIREYLDLQGRSPFGRWFGELDKTAAAKVVIALTRISLGNFSNVKSVSAVFWNTRSTMVPAIAFISAEMANRVILLAGGSKKRQPKDAEVAKARWHDYKQRKLKDI